MKLEELGFNKIEQQLVIFTKDRFQIVFDMKNKTYSINENPDELPKEVLESIEIFKQENGF